MKLYPFQQKILDGTDGFNRVAYYLDMGLGKTFVGTFKLLQFDKSALLVCQKSQVDYWIDHLCKYTPWAIFDGTTKKGLEAFCDLGGICVINYDLVFRRKELLSLDNFTLCLDESSLVQNPQAKRTKAILKMNPANVILLSGTPTAGKYENLWSQLNLLGWDLSLKAYHSGYVNWTTLDVGGVPIRIVDKLNPYKNVERLKAKMRQHGAVFLKTEEVFDLPRQNIIEINVPKIKEYNTFQKKSIVTVGGAELVGDTTLTKRMYSRMLCGHYNAEKLGAFRDLCQSTADRLIVFYNFNGELEALRRICAELERPVSEINGHCKDLTAYENEPDSVTLIQYKAGSMGLNLQKANKIIYFTLTEEADLFLQSMKRIHRIGQEKPCFYYILLCKNSVEDKEILPTLGIRKGFTDALFTE